MQPCFLRNYTGDDDELLENWMLLVEELDVGDSEHGLEHAVSSLYRANPRESSVLILLLFLNFYFLNYTAGTLYKTSGEMGVELSLD
ncbi:hypothetical protein Tco_0158047 [Tanacetum coccineum]